MSEKAAERSSQHILVVDDDPDINQLVSNFLRREGHPVSVYANGTDALAGVREHRPALIILDVLMPRMTGLEVLEQVRSDEQISETPIILLTASVTAAHEEKAMAAGATDYMRKPFDGAELVRRVHSVLDREERSGSVNVSGE